MSASKAPESEIMSAALMSHLVHGCATNMQHWLEAESELMRLYDEYTAVELADMLQAEAWSTTFRAF
jgi:hypothetical protein